MVSEAGAALMGLGAWIRGKKDGLEQNIAQRVVDKALGTIDAWGAKRWPVAWIRVRRMGLGWKTLLGAALAFAPEITAFAEQYVPAVVYALGMEDAQVQSVLSAVGKALFFIGAADKYLKFTKPIERRHGERIVTSESGARFVISPVSSEPKASVLPAPLGMTDEARVVFDHVIGTETKKGETVETAVASAEKAVAKVTRP